MPRYNSTERVGINAVESIVLNELNWIFREQPIVDVGVDAQIEQVEASNPTGKLVAVQIKTGRGHFHETDDGLVYYGSLTHLDYWTSHALPVLLIAHLPDTNETFWAHVSSQTVERTESRWKIKIPKANPFSKANKDSLSAFFEGTPAQQKFRKLSLDEPLMRHIVNGGKVSVELQDWVNKSLGRTQVEVFVSDNDGGEGTLSREWFIYYTGYGMRELAEKIFPWARVTIDDEFYDENYNGDDRPDDEPFGDDEDSAEQELELPVYPYASGGGEVEYYRLKLILNELGDAFLTVSDHLATPL